MARPFLFFECIHTVCTVSDGKKQKVSCLLTFCFYSYLISNAGALSASAAPRMDSSTLTVLRFGR